MTIDRNRIRTLKQGDDISGPVVYWMGRDQRARDNWALLHAQKLALKKRVPLIVVFCLVPEFPGATVRQYSFMLAALIETEEHLRKKHIAFFLLPGFPEDVLPAFLVRHKCSVLIADFDPLKIRRRWNPTDMTGGNICILSTGSKIPKHMTNYGTRPRPKWSSGVKCMAI
jgi:deoxyribodipyrimidine photo-lyase